MFPSYDEVQIVEVNGVKLGGKPGQLPTVLVGSIFHQGHRIVYDHFKGEFNREKAEHLLNLQDELSEKTGNPCMVDVVGQSAQALERYIDFVASVTDAPLLVNGLTSKVRIEASRYAVTVGLADRIIYNSINFKLEIWELEAIRKLGLKTALIQAFNPRNPSPTGSLKILTEEEPLLLLKSLEAGISNPLLLAPVLDVPGVGVAAETVTLLRRELKLPVGAPPLGVIGRWRKDRGYDLSVVRTCRGATLALIQAAGADFIIYGSIGKAPHVFPACALIDAMIAYTARFKGVRPLTKKHPLYRVF